MSFSNFWASLGTTLSLITNKTEQALVAYLKALRHYLKFAFTVSLSSLLLLIVGVIFNVSWMVGIFIVISGTLLFVGLFFSMPFLLLAGELVKRIDPLRKSSVALLAFLFWICVVAIYFTTIPVMRDPATTLFTVLFFALLAFSYAAFGIRISPRIAVFFGAVFFLIMTVGSFLPMTKSAATFFVEKIDSSIASSIHSTTPIEVNLKTYSPFNLETGSPQVWYHKMPDGSYEFYDKPGFHRSGARLQIITPEVMVEWEKTLSPKPNLTPKKVDIQSYPPFDPVSGKPRAWYHKSPDGSYEFYDKPGFSWDGERLELVTKKALSEWGEFVKRLTPNPTLILEPIQTPTPVITPKPMTELNKGSRKTLEVSEGYTEGIRIPRNCYWTFDTIRNEQAEPIKFRFKNGSESGWIFPGDRVDFGGNANTKEFQVKIRSGQGQLVIMVGPCH